MGTEEYATSIFRVKEIINYSGATQIPGTPAYVEGIINLRGKVIPVIDMAVRFGLTVNRKADMQAVIVESAGREIGVLVDVVNEVLRLDEADIDTGSSMTRTSQCIRGIGKVGERLMILLDLDLLFSSEEIDSLTAAC